MYSRQNGCFKEINLPTVIKCYAHIMFSTKVGQKKIFFKYIIHGKKLMMTVPVFETTLKNNTWVVDINKTKDANVEKNFFL